MAVNGGAPCAERAVGNGPGQLLASPKKDIGILQEGFLGSPSSVMFVDQAVPGDADDIPTFTLENWLQFGNLDEDCSQADIATMNLKTWMDLQDGYNGFGSDSQECIEVGRKSRAGTGGQTHQLGGSDNGDRCDETGIISDEVKNEQYGDAEVSAQQTVGGNRFENIQGAAWSAPDVGSGVIDSGFNPTCSPTETICYSQGGYGDVDSNRGGFKLGGNCGSFFQGNGGDCDSDSFVHHSGGVLDVQDGSGGCGAGSGVEPCDRAGGVQGGGDDGCGVGSGGGPGDSKWDCGEEGVQGGGDYGCGVGSGGGPGDSKWDCGEEQRVDNQGVMNKEGDSRLPLGLDLSDN